MKAPHALITGVTGGGKTYFLFYMIRELFKRNAEVRLLDPKVSDLSFMKNVIGAEKWQIRKDRYLNNYEKPMKKWNTVLE